MGWYDRKVRRVRDLSCGDTRIVLELEVRRLDCRHCGKVKREQLDFLADNPLYTKRFAYYVGRHCLAINDVRASPRCGHDGQRKRVAHMPTGQQQQKQADQNWAKITHTTSR
jgi:hypothetical protein